MSRQSIRQKELVFDDADGGSQVSGGSKNAAAAGALEPDNASLGSYESGGSNTSHHHREIQPGQHPGQEMLTPRLRSNKYTTADDIMETDADRRRASLERRAAEQGGGDDDGGGDEVAPLDDLADARAMRREQLEAFKEQNAEEHLLRGGDHARARAAHGRVVDQHARDSGKALKEKKMTKFQPARAPVQVERSSMDQISESYVSSKMLADATAGNPNSPFTALRRLQNRQAAQATEGYNRHGQYIGAGSSANLDEYLSPTSQRKGKPAGVEKFSPKARGRVGAASTRGMGVRPDPKMGLGQAHLNIHTMERPMTPEQLAELAERGPGALNVIAEADAEEQLALRDAGAPPDRPSVLAHAIATPSEPPTEDAPDFLSHRRTALGCPGLVNACGGHRLPAPKLLPDGSGWSTEVQWEYLPIEAPRFGGWPRSKATPSWMRYFFALTYLHRYGWNGLSGALDSTGALGSDRDDKVRVRPTSPSVLGARAAPGESELVELGSQRVAPESFEPIVQALRRLQRDGHLPTDPTCRLHFSAADAADYLRGPGLARFVGTRKSWWSLLTKADRRTLIVVALRRGTRTTAIGPRSPDWLSEETTYATTLPLRRRRLLEHDAKLRADEARLRVDDPEMSGLLRTQRHLSNKGLYGTTMRLVDAREMDRRTHATNARAKTARLAATRATAALAEKLDREARAEAELERRRSKKLSDAVLDDHHLEQADDDAVRARLPRPLVEVVQPQPKLPWSPWELDPVDALTAAAMENAAYKTPFKWRLDDDACRTLDKRTVGLVRTTGSSSRPSTAPGACAGFEEAENVAILGYERPVSPTTHEARAYLVEGYLG